MFFSDDMIYNTISSNSEIMAMLSTYRIPNDATEYKALIAGKMIPQYCKNLPVINYFITNPVNPGLAYKDYLYNINCRAEDEYTALRMQQILSVLFNERTINFAGTHYFVTVAVLGIIVEPKQGEYNILNAPLNVRVKGVER